MQRLRAYAKHMADFDGLITRHLRDHSRVSDYASAARYVERYLLQEARRMLAYTREPVGVICWHLGFEDPAYFSRSFRRQAGEASLDYRARFQD